jgi:hypothetical protein
VTTRLLECANDGAADVAGGPGDEDAHGHYVRAAQDPCC